MRPPSRGRRATAATAGPPRRPATAAPTARRPAVGGAELAEIPPAGFDERVIGRERGQRDGVGASVADLRFIEMSEAFVHDSQIVERVSELG